MTLKRLCSDGGLTVDKSCLRINRLRILRIRDASFNPKNKTFPHRTMGKKIAALFPFWVNRGSHYGGNQIEFFWISIGRLTYGLEIRMDRF